VNVITRLRNWLAGPIADEWSRAEARRIRERKETIRGSHGGKAEAAGSGAVQPPPTPDVLDPKQ